MLAGNSTPMRWCCDAYEGMTDRFASGRSDVCTPVEEMMALFRQKRKSR